jgi:hypothetical protein
VERLPSNIINNDALPLKSKSLKPIIPCNETPEFIPGIDKKRYRPDDGGYNE